MAVEYKDDLFDRYDLVEQFSGFAVNRGDLIAINGKTIHELMFEEFKETNKESDLGEFYQWYQDNLAEKTKDYVMEAYRNNTYVEMFMVDDTGKLLPKANRIRFSELKAKEAQAAEQTQQPKQDLSETTESLDDDNTMDVEKASAAPQLDEEKIRAARADIRSTNQKAQEAMKNIPLSERKKGFDNEAVKFQSQYPQQLASLTDELRAADRFLLTGSDQYKHMQESLKTMSDLMQKLGNPPTKEQVKALQTASADLSSKVDTYWNYKDADNTTKKRSDREKRRIAAARAVKEWCSELQKSVKTLDKGYAFFAPEMEAQRAAEAREVEQRAAAQEPTRETFHQKTDNYMERHYGVSAGKEYKEDWLEFPVKMKDSKKKPRYVGVMQHLSGKIKVDRNYLSDYMYDLTQKQKQGEFETINLDEPTEKEKTLAEQQEIRKDKCKDMVARMVAVEMIANERRATFKRTGSFKNDENSLEAKYAKDPNAFLKGVKDIPRVRDILEDMSLDTMRNFLNQNEAKSIADDFAKQAQAEREAQKKAQEKAVLEEAEPQKAAQKKEEAENDNKKEQGAVMQ